MKFLKRVIGSGKKVSELMLALDIGTEVVKVLIFKVDPEQEKAIIIGEGTAKQRLGSMTAGVVSDIESVIATCQQAISQAESQGGVVGVRDTVIGIAGELVKGTTTTVHYERANPNMPIDLPELRNILQKVQWKAFDRIKKQLAWETGQEVVDVHLINADIVRGRIDGHHRITNPIDFTGRNVSISIFNAYAPMIHLNALQKIGDELGLNIVDIAAEPYAIAQSMSVYNNPEFGAIIIDIGGGTTDVAVVRNGGLEGTVMFALGGQAFTKRLAKFFGVSFSEAEQIKLKYSTEQVKSEWSIKIDKLFRDDIAVWMSGLEIALQSFCGIGVLPSKVYLCGGGSGLPGIRDALLSGTLNKSLPISDVLQVSYLHPKDISNVLDNTGKLVTPQLMAVSSLVSHAINIKFRGDKIIDDVLRRAVKILQN